MWNTLKAWEGTGYCSQSLGGRRVYHDYLFLILFINRDMEVDENLLRLFGNRRTIREGWGMFVPIKTRGKENGKD